MNRRNLPLLLAFILGTVPALHAQAKIGVYGTVGAENTGLTGEGWSKAGTLGLYYGLANLGPAAVSVDARADLSSNANTYAFGPRVALHTPAFPLKPYGELLIGAIHYTTRSGGSKTSSDFAYRWVVGLDETILPHVDWRILDFSYGGGLSEPGKSVHIKTLTTGLVLRF
jgi:hypothetical protein